MKPSEIYVEIEQVKKEIDAANTKRLQCLAENLQFIKDITLFVLEHGTPRPDTLHHVRTYHTEFFEMSVLDHSAGYNTSQGVYVGNLLVIVKYNLRRVLNVRIGYVRNDTPHFNPGIELTDKLTDVGELSGAVDSYAYIIPGDWQLEPQKLCDEAELETAAARLKHLQAELQTLNFIIL